MIISLHLDERRLRLIFRASVALKGIHAVIECVSGLMLYVLNTAQITQIIARLTQHELTEDPHDLIAGYLLHSAQTLSISTLSFYAFYLLSHGIIKLILVAGLLKEKLIAYPLSLVTLTAFIAYQLYRYSRTGGAALLLLTAFDIVVILLIWHEWRILRRPAP